MNLSQIHQAVSFREEKTRNRTAVSIFWLTTVRYTHSWKMQNTQDNDLIPVSIC